MESLLELLAESYLILVFFLTLYLLGLLSFKPIKKENNLQNSNELELKEDKVNKKEIEILFSNELDKMEKVELPQILSNTIINKQTEKKMDEIISNMSKLEDIVEIVDKNDYIAINQEETNSYLINKFLIKTTPEEVKKSNDLKSELKLQVIEKVKKIDHDDRLSKIVKLGTESVEFTLVAINECLTQTNKIQPIVLKEPMNTNLQKYYLNNLVCGGEAKKEVHTIIFKDSEKFSFDKLKKNSGLAGEFLSVIETTFYEMFPKSENYYLDISTIFKGSCSIVVNSNITEEQLKKFLDTLDKKKQTGPVKKVVTELKVPEVKFSADMLDSRGNYDFTLNADEQIRGKLPYYQPKGWKRLGLKVSGLYDNGNDDWLAMNGNHKEWAVGFHGTKVEYGSAIAEKGLIQGGGQGCQNHHNLNNLNKDVYAKCGKGVYFGDKIEVCESGYTTEFDCAEMKLKMAFQCRLNPKEIRITDYYHSKAYIVPNDKLGCYDNIRPYGILIKEVK